MDYVGQILLFFGLWLGIWSPIAAIVFRLVEYQPLQSIEPSQKIPLVLSLYAVAPFPLWIILRWYGIAWNDIGLTSIEVLGPSLLQGLVIGLGSFIALFSFYVGIGWADFNWPRDSQNGNDQNHGGEQSESNVLAIVISMLGLLLALLLLSGMIGFTEELVFRGFLTSRLISILNVWLAIAIASLIFSILHLIWDGKSAVSQLPGLWLMGSVLTVAWWVNQQSIGLAWGLHSGWVWAIAIVDSFNLIRYRDTAPVWGVGLDQQPLAGIPGIVSLIAIGVGIGYLW